MDMKDTNGDCFVAPNQDHFTDEDLRAIAAFTRWQNAANFYTFGRVNMYERQSNVTLQRAMEMVVEVIRNPRDPVVGSPPPVNQKENRGFGFNG